MQAAYKSGATTAAQLVQAYLERIQAYDQKGPKLNVVISNGSIITYRRTADGFSAETPLGENFDAKFDGNFYLVEDDPHTLSLC